MVSVVVDVNVIVSALMAPGGPPGAVLRAMHEGRFVILTSLGHQIEMAEVLSRRKFDGRPGFRTGAAAALSTLRRQGTRVTVERFDDVTIRDPKDQYLVALAVSGNADYLVTGDDDLLAAADDVRPHGIEIVAPTALLSILESSN